MTTSLLYAQISVTDFDATLAFYVDGLGFEVRNNVEYGDQRWVTLGGAGDASAELVLSKPSSGRSEADAAALTTLVASGSFMYVFRVADLDAAFAQAKATGAEVVQEPTKQDWGPADAAFKDPSGNVIRLNQI